MTHGNNLLSRQLLQSFACSSPQGFGLPHAQGHVPCSREIFHQELANRRVEVENENFVHGRLWIISLGICRFGLLCPFQGKGKYQVNSLFLRKEVCISWQRSGSGAHKGIEAEKRLTVLIEAELWKIFFRNSFALLSRVTQSEKIPIILSFNWVKSEDFKIGPPPLGSRYLPALDRHHKLLRKRDYLKANFRSGAILMGPSVSVSFQSGG